MALSNINNIDPTYPVAGIDQPSQGFRDNFAEIKQSLLDLDSAVITVLNDLVDVDTSSVAPTLNDVLRYDGTKWVPNTIASLGYITAVVDDTTPVLSGNLDVDDNVILNGGGSDEVVVQGQLISYKDNATSLRMRGPSSAVDPSAGADVQSYMGIFYNTGFALTSSSGLETRAVFGANVEMDLELQAPRQLRLTAVDDTQTDGQIRMASKTDVVIHTRASAEIDSVNNIVFDRFDQGSVGAANTSTATIETDSGDMLLWPGRKDGDTAAKLVVKKDMDMDTHTISGVVDPTAAQDVATKNYVDNTVGGTLNDLADDTTPQLGGNLDVDDNVILNAGATDEVVVQGQLISYKDNATSLRMKGPSSINDPSAGANVQSYMGIFYNAGFALTSSSGLETRAILGANVEMDMELQAPRQLRLTAVDDSQSDGQVRVASKTDITFHTRTDAEVDGVNNIVFDRDTQGTTGALNTSSATIETNSGDLVLWPGRKDGDTDAGIRTKGTVTHQPQTSFGSSGDVQSNLYILRNVTTDATQTELFIDGASTRAGLPDDTTWFFRVHVVARRTDADDESAGYIFEGVIDRNAGTTALVGTVAKTIMAEDNAAWDVDVDADATNDSLRIQVTGEAAKTVRWVAKVDTTEVTG